MALFNKKMTAKAIMAAIEALSEDEKAELFKEFDEETPAEAPTDETPTEETEVIEEETEETPAETTEEESETVETVEEIPETNEELAEEQNFDAVLEALGVRITKLEELFAEAQKNSEEAFGEQPKHQDGDKGAYGDDAVMKSYQNRR